MKTHAEYLAELPRVMKTATVYVAMDRTGYIVGWGFDRAYARKVDPRVTYVRKAGSWLDKVSP